MNAVVVAGWEEAGGVEGVGGWGWEEGWGGVYLICAWPSWYDYRPSHPYNAGSEHVGFSPTKQAFACTKVCVSGELSYDA